MVSEKFYGSVTLDQITAMPAQDRIDFFRGRVPDYSTRVGKEVAVLFPDANQEQLKIVQEAFRMRVEDFLNEPGGGHGGGALDHLSQIGRQVITQEAYEVLHARAAALAATVIEEAGFPEFAQRAYATYGKMMAPRELETSYNFNNN